MPRSPLLPALRRVLGAWSAAGTAAAPGGSAAPAGPGRGRHASGPSLPPRPPSVSGRRLLPLLVLALLSGPAAAQTAPARLPPASQLYHLDWGPLALAEIRVSREPRPDGVQLVMDARTLGVATLFADLLIRQTTTRIDDGPRIFRVEGAVGGEGSVREVRWPAPDARPRVTEPGPPPDGPVTPIPEGALDGAVDPGSAALLTLAQAEAGRGCGGTWRLFDGVRLMEMTVIDEGMDRLGADRDWTYAGPALRCRIRLERLGGFPADEPRETEEREYDRRLWIAELDGAMVPVRLEIDWPLGAAVARVDLRRPAPRRRRADRRAPCRWGARGASRGEARLVEAARGPGRTRT